LFKFRFRSLICLCFFFIISSETSAQFRSKSIISGKIIDVETGMPIPNVNIFLAYTTIGTITNREGKYLLKNIPQGQYDLIVSHIGYELTTFQITLRKSEILEHNIQLKPRVLKGKTVRIETTTPKEWEENLKTFKLLFIGRTKNARYCKILNPEVINLKLHPKTKIFTAYSDSLIRLTNEALGLKIGIIIDFFSYNFNTEILKYEVYPKFEMMKHQEEKELKKWVYNRKTTYKGSFRHFISALASCKLKEEKFQVYQYGYFNSSENKFIKGRAREIRNYKEILLSPDTLGIQYFHFDNLLYCDYQRRYTSWMQLVTKYVQIDSLGNCYGELNLIKDGLWGKARIADVLPFDYDLDKN